MTDWMAGLDRDRPLLVTGAAGFIGFHLSEKLARAGLKVVGIDNLNDYYDPALKQARLDILSQYPGFSFHRLDLEDQAGLASLFDEHGFTHVANMAAQAGVRYSLDNPMSYARSNVTGFLTLLEECRRAQVAHLVYASSSSVYGGNSKLPFSTVDRVDHPVSLYAATKKAGELMAHSYSHLYNIPATGLRFFTVYGPWGRPDMAVFIFTKALFEGRPIQVFNHGQMQRDFTFIDDIIEGVVRVIPLAPERGSEGAAPHRVFNIGNSRPEELTEMIALLEELTGRKANQELREMQPGDVPATYADVADLQEAVGFRPDTPLREGLSRFVAWYRDFYRV